MSSAPRCSHLVSKHQDCDSEKALKPICSVTGAMTSFILCALLRQAGPELLLGHFWNISVELGQSSLQMHRNLQELESNQCIPCKCSLFGFGIVAWCYLFLTFIFLWIICICEPSQQSLGSTGDLLLNIFNHLSVSTPSLPLLSLSTEEGTKSLWAPYHRGLNSLRFNTQRDRERENDQISKRLCSTWINWLKVSGLNKLI